MATRLRYQDAAPGSPLYSVIQGATRGNPCLDIDIDIVAIQAAAGATTVTDWPLYGTLGGGLTANWDGALGISTGAPTTLFSQTASVSVYQQFNDSAGSPGPAIFWIDFFPDPSIVGTGPITLANIDLWLSKAYSTSYFTGTFVFNITQFDDRWNRNALCTPIQVQARAVTTAPYTLNLSNTGQPIVFYPGQLVAESGQGLDGSGNPRNIALQVLAGDPVSFIPTLRGFSIGIQTTGAAAWTAPCLGCAANGGGTPQFDVTKFWRVAATQNRNCGPYDPYVVGAAPGNLGYFPGDGMGDTGAVVILGQSYGGAIAVTNGYWGRAKQIIQGPPGPANEGGRYQNPSQHWEQPYHNLRVASYAGWTTLQRTLVQVYNLGIVPTEQVEIRIDDAQPAGTSITYALAGSTTGTGGWVSLGTASDGLQLTGAQLYQYYQFTVVFHPSANNLATPQLTALYVTARLLYNTFTYVANQIDSTVSVDPVEEQSEIQELKLALNRIGPRDYTDPATTVNTNYAPTSLECYVYAKNRVSGLRYFLNLFRLENREPGDGVENMTFVGGLDQLSCEIPPLVESYAYPGSGSDTVTVVTSLGGGQYRIQVATTPWSGALNPNGLDGFYYYGTSGANNQMIFPIQANTGNTVTFTPLDANANPQPAPQVGDTFQIHSQIYSRPDATYSGVDFGTIYQAILRNLAQVPTRFQGVLPGTIGRTGTGVVTNDNSTPNINGSVDTSYVNALQYLTDIAVHCGGFVAWRRGKIDFVNFYGPASIVDTWDDRQIADLTPAVGADLRMPSIYVPYDYDLTQGTFANGATYNDINAVIGWGRANLYDIYQMPNSICKWNDPAGAEALWLANTYLQAWSTGRRYWKVKTVLQYPWYQIGDCIAVVTDLYTDRILNFSLDGLTDLGAPIKGRVQAVGIIISMNLWGDEFVLAIRGLSSITPIAGTNSNTGGAYTSLACPAIAVVVEYENISGVVQLMASVSWTPPTSAFYGHMEVTVQATGNIAATHQMGTVPPARVGVAANTQYTFTPVVVTVGGIRTTGTPVAVNTGTGRPITTPITVGPDSSDVHVLVGTYQVTAGAATPTSYSTWVQNPSAITISGPCVWTSAGTLAVIVMGTNPVAIDGIYTITFNLVSSFTGTSNAFNVRAMVEYNIGVTTWQLYGYTPTQTAPYSASSLTTVLNLSGLVNGAISVAFRLTAQIQFMGTWVTGTGTITATGVSVAWNYSPSAYFARTGIQATPAASQPHTTMIPNPTPITVANSVAGEMTVASLNAGATNVLQMNDGHAMASYNRYALDSTSSDTTINQGSGSPISMGSGIPVTAGETWTFEIQAAGNGNATGPNGIFVYLACVGGSFSTANWIDSSNTSSSTAFSGSHGTTGTPGVILSYGTAGVIRQTWYCVIGTGGTVHLTSYAQNSADPGTIYAGAMLRGTRLS